MKKMIQIFSLLFFILNSTILISQNSIYHFKDKTNLRGWAIVNDDVMGGVSKSNLKINKDGIGVFEGRISTAYNGGFASVRYNCERIFINNNKNLILNIKGDKKEYKVRVKANRDDYYSFTLPFKTSGEWEEIIIPLKDMYASFRGRRLNLQNFNNDYFEQITLFIGNNRNEYFNLKIKSISLQ